MERLACLLLTLSIGVLSAEEPRLNRTIELFEMGKPAIGGFVFDMSDEVAIELSVSGLDFAIVDLEHRPVDISELRTFLLGMTNRQRILEKQSVQLDVTPIIRLPDSSPHQVELLAKQVLNTGAFGLMFPTVESRAEALMAVRASRYPQKQGARDIEPLGLRGFEPFHPGMWFWGLTTMEYFDRADAWPLDPDGEILVVIQIESAAGVENIEEILSVPGIGAVMIGSFDLSTSLGVPGDVSSALVRDATQRVVEACVQKGIPVGSTAGSVEENLEMGQLLLPMGYFGGLDPQGAANLEKFKRLRGD